MNYSSRFFLYAPFLSFVALAAGVMVWWWMAATSLDKQLTAWNGHEIAPGVKISFAAKRIAGFPFRLDVLLDHVKVEVAASQGPLVWGAEHFASHTLTYGLNQSIYEAAGQQELSWKDDSGAQHDFAFVPGTMRASSISAKGALARFDLDIVQITSADLSANRAQFHVRRDPATDALDLVLSGEAIKLSPPLRAGFGDTISHLNLTARFIPGSPFTPFLSGSSDWRRAAEAWRNHNGTLAIDNLAIAWGALDANGTGSLGLTGDHSIDGKMTLNVAGLGALGMAASDAQLESALFAIASQNPALAQAKLSIPIELRQGHVFAENAQAGAIGPIY
jgi:hypothetical protein